MSMKTDITFSPDDLALIKAAADESARWIQAGGLHFRSYQERRYEFAKEWAEGHHWNTPKSISWARRIKREIGQLKKHAAPADTGAFPPGATNSAK